MSTKQIVGILDALNADPDLSRGCRHVCGLAANIVLVCDQRGEELGKAADTIERLQKELAALKREPETVAGHGIHELARMLDEMSELVAMPDNMKNAARTAGVALLSHAKALAQMQDAGQNEIGILLQERDAAMAEVERLKGELNDRSDEMKTRRSEAFFSGYVASKQAR